ncbi:MAG: hydantoinase/oxoprolinase family protein [Myxococcales bacterium]|nr:hydantoinase/oxoprolinase family protein [Myxococcales bacterium]
MTETTLSHLSHRLRIGVDTGGTFTDFVMQIAPDAPLWTHKRLSTPEDPSRAVLEGIAYLLQRWQAHRATTTPEATQDPWDALLAQQTTLQVIHGSTVATNALLERKIGRAAFVTTEGFEDTLFLGRQDRPSLYALHVQRPEPPIQEGDCLGVKERILFNGQIASPLHNEEIDKLMADLQVRGVESVAVSLLHSYANPSHEKAIASAIREHFPHVHLTLSHELLPEIREYERGSTCAINACVAPLMNRYVRRLSEAIAPHELRIMVSNGGQWSAEEVCNNPVQTILSGPAGGLVGALRLAQQDHIQRIITFDMGGTSSDVALCDGDLPRTTESDIDGMPVHLPLLDIHTVGAGGGSIAWIDAGGALRVGPRSAGASPGPACYGRQDPPQYATVTDAHLLLGHLDPKKPLGEDLYLQPQAAEQAIAPLAKQLNKTLEETADGILRIAEATMVRAIQRISVQKGYDPRDFALVPFGGAGGLHACRLAEALGIRTIWIPRHPGLLSAVGMLCAPPLYLFSQALLFTLSPDDQGEYPDPRSFSAFQEAHQQLQVRADQVMPRKTDHDEAASLESYALDMRYKGQSYEITIPFQHARPEPSEDLLQDFQRQHQSLYGYIAEGRPIEIVALRLERKRTAPPTPSHHAPPQASTDPPDTSVPPERWPRYPREKLLLDQKLQGPCLIDELSATTLVAKDWTLHLTEHGGLLLQYAPTSPSKGDL